MSNRCERLGKWLFPSIQRSVEKKVQQFSMQHNVVVRFLIALYYLMLSRTDLLCYTMMILDHMSNASILSLPLPFFAFFWGTLCSPRPPKFFWITVITYTEAMMVVKFIFQFGFFPITESPLNDPLNPMTMIGLNKSHYYVVWDVALLMVLFFHRYILKILGLWKDLKPGDFSSDKEDDKKKWDFGSSQDLNAIIAKEEEFDNQEFGPDAQIQIHTLNLDKDNLTEELVLEQVEEEEKESRCVYCSSFLSFFKQLLYPSYKYVTDMYSFMFLCDIVCFLILAFGYSSFGVAAEQGDVVTDIKSNKVPLPFVSMLISIMILIIIDRGIYLRKSVVGKLVFQYLLVTAVHAWIFFALPLITGRSIMDNSSAQLWYFVKCVYFLLSAWQIKNGYRSRRLGNLLTKRYSLLNYCFYTGFMAAPFLFELRTLIDWIWTETSMPIFDYFSMENIYAVVYRLKCMRKMEKDYPIARGEPLGSFIKYGMGLPILIFVIVILWLPLLLFALLNAIGVGLLPMEAKFSVSIKGYPPLYEAEAHGLQLRTVAECEYNFLKETYYDHQSLLFLRDYNPNVIQKATFSNESNVAWAISVPTRRKLMKELNNPSSNISIVIKWEFTRPRESSEKEPVTQTGSHVIVLKKTDAAYKALIRSIESQSKKSETVALNFAFPQFVEVPSYGEVQAVRPLLKKLINSSTQELHSSYNSIYLRKFRELINDSGSLLVTEFWGLETINREVATNRKGSCGSVRKNDTEMTVFIDKVFPSALDAFTSKGIIGVYVVVVLAAGRFMRAIVVTSPLEVIISEMPNVDRLLQLCLDIFLVREAKDFMLELDLFAKLIFLIRSPETLIRWTRTKIH